MEPVASEVDAILDRYRENLRTYGVRVTLRASGAHEATIEVVRTGESTSCAGECGIPLPALLNLLRAELDRVEHLDRVLWTSPPAVADGAP
jgi:hypothetical protein